MIPKVVSPGIYKNIPNINNIIDAWLATLTPVAILVLNTNGLYAFWCCIACPTSWAATPAAAIEFP